MASGKRWTATPTATETAKKMRNIPFNEVRTLRTHIDLDDPSLPSLQNFLRLSNMVSYYTCIRHCRCG